jgi:hypothetical protein
VPSVWAISFLKIKFTVFLVHDIYFLYCTGTRRRDCGGGRLAGGTVPPAAGDKNPIIFLLPNIIFSNILTLEIL